MADPAAARALRDAVTAPTWVDIAGYTLEKVHTNTLARALATRTPAAHRLAAALWKRASGEDLADFSIRAVEPEYRLKRGRGAIVDLYLELAVGSTTRALAIVAKVDGAPDGAQLTSEANALGIGSHRKLILLTLGGAQVCRIAGETPVANAVPRWRVADLLALAADIEAASPVLDVARAWLEELRREEQRRTLASLPDEHLRGCGYRDRLLVTYRYALLADALAPEHGRWNVAVLPYGVVMSEFPSWQRVPHGDMHVTVYLEVVDGVLRVKAGAWAKAADPRAATLTVVPRVRAALEAKGFRVEAARRAPGRSVTLLSAFPKEGDASHEARAAQLRRAFEAWRSVAWAG
jgi:hypothetical protein